MSGGGGGGGTGGSEPPVLCIPGSRLFVQRITRGDKCCELPKKWVGCGGGRGGGSGGWGDQGDPDLPPIAL